MDSPQLVVAACVCWWVVVALQSWYWWEIWVVDVLVMGGGYVEGCGPRVCAEFPLAEFSGIPFREVVLSWHVGHKTAYYNKIFVV